MSTMMIQGRMTDFMPQQTVFISQSNYTGWLIQDKDRAYGSLWVNPELGVVTNGTTTLQLQGNPILDF